jgi:hypothetical protein
VLNLTIKCNAIHIGVCDACSDNEIIEKQFGEPAPKKVRKTSDVIEKCIWILRRQFKFVATRKLNLKS